MNLGFLTVHPLTIPFGVEIVHSAGSITAYAVLLYNGVVAPELQQLKEIIQLL